MGKNVSTGTMKSHEIVRLDEILVRRFDAEVRAGEERARGHLACRIGCTECCVGPFDITGLDAERLRRGLRELEGKDPEAARGVRDRARGHWQSMVGSFPGAKETGALGDDEEARERFCAAFETVACPVLDPETGGCLLYGFRPLSSAATAFRFAPGRRRSPPAA
jgi:hypothetical protein